MRESQKNGRALANVRVLLLGGIAGAAAAFALFWLWILIATYYPLPFSGDKYDLLRDIILIMLALVAAAGFLTYKVVERSVRESLQKEFEKDILDRQLELYRSTYLNLGLLAHELAAIASKKDDKRRIRDRAIDFTRRAKEAKPPTPEYAKVRTALIDNNLAYYLAAMHDEQGDRLDLKEEAQVLAEKVRSLYEPGTPFANKYFLETDAFVSARFASNNHEIQSAMQKIQKYLELPSMKELKPHLEESLKYLKRMSQPDR